MVIFITENPNHRFDGVTLGQLGVNRVYDYLDKALKSGKLVAKDYETNGLDPFMNDALLLAIGDKQDQFVIDCQSVDFSKFKDYADINWLGHNIKFDASFSRTKYDMLCTNLKDTQIADQKLYQNCGYSARKNPNGYLWNLNAVIQRHLGFTPAETDKRIRNSFIGANPNKMIYETRHIHYVAGDIGYLHEVFEKQMQIAKKYNLEWWLNNVEFPLISVLMEAELEGFYFDTDKWSQNIEDNKDRQHKYAVALDNELKRLRDSLLSTGEDRQYLTGGKYSRERKRKPSIKKVGLFGEMDSYEFFAAKGFGVSRTKKNRKVKVPKSKAYIDWNSADTLLETFAKLKQPAPLQGDSGKIYGYLIPYFDTSTGKVNKRYGIDTKGNKVEILKYSEKEQGWTTDKKAFQKYLVDYPNSPMRDFISIYNKYSRATTEISNFGSNYLDKVNKFTDRIHTIYRQMNTVNGRLQSGGGNKQNDRYNSQNIPRDEKFRHCFKGGKDSNGNWYSVVTCDLSGAEVTFMCDKAHDEQLYQWAVINDDSHSPMVQNVWRNIFLYRAGLAAGTWKKASEYFARNKNVHALNRINNSTNPDVTKWRDLANNFVVSKKVNKPYRTAGKNGTFGGIYGMKAKKAQETFNNTDAELAKTGQAFDPVNVTIEEGKVILYAQKTAIPKTFKMVEDNVRKGISQGFFILNNRSKSRIWLPEVISLKRSLRQEFGKELQYGMTKENDFYVVNDGEVYELDWGAKKDYDGQLRNVPISGTQADCLKEAMVDIQKYIRDNNLDCQLLSQVHDELVYRCPKNMDGQSDEWKDEPHDCYFEFDKDTMTKEYYMENFHDDNHVVSITHGGQIGKHSYMFSASVSFPKFVQLSMIQAANRFLDHYKMKADFEVMDSWTK